MTKTMCLSMSLYEGKASRVARPTTSQPHPSIMVISIVISTMVLGGDMLEWGAQQSELNFESVGSFREKKT